VPVAVDVNRHAVLMTMIDGVPLTQRYRLREPGRVYRQCIDQLSNLAARGLVHCDFNEFNIMVNEDEDITIIDFPQMVSTRHPNAEELFVRDLKCLHKFFLRRYDYRAEEDDEGREDPAFRDVAVGGVGRGEGADVERSLDVSLRASGFSQDAVKELDAHVEATRKDKEEEEEEEEEGGVESDDDDDDDEEDRFGFVERGEEEVEGADAGYDPEADAAAAAAIARLYAGGKPPAVIDDDDDTAAADDAAADDDAADDDDAFDAEASPPRRAPAPAPSVASARLRRRAPTDASGSQFSCRSRADLGNDPDIVRDKLKRQAARKNARPGAAHNKPAGTRNHTKDKGGRRGAKHHAFKYNPNDQA
jgi:RIO kinase 2